MTVNLHDHIHPFVDAFKQTEQVEAFEKAVAAVKEDDGAKAVYMELREVMSGIYEKQAQGQEVTQEEGMKYEEVAQRAQQNELVDAMLRAEQGVGMLMEEVTKHLLEPVQKIYETLD